MSLDKQNQHRRYKISYTRHMLHLRRGLPQLKHTSVVVKKQKTKRLPTNRKPSNAGEDCLFEPCRTLKPPTTGVQPLKVLSVHHELLKAHDRINVPSLRLVHIRYCMQQGRSRRESSSTTKQAAGKRGREPIFKVSTQVSRWLARTFQEGY